ncbi:MAG: type II restriction endonuclease [Gammaproteobacteria bacterium]|nr:type II restriction endonuclease [Gammaproteobacteria bacterium]
MNKEYLSTYFEGVAAKRLNAADVSTRLSDKHELNEVGPLRNLLGEEMLDNCPTTFVHISDQCESFFEDSFITWYGTKTSDLKYSEQRLCFSSNTVMEMAKEGDLLIVAKRPKNKIVVFIVPWHGTIENQMLWLFRVPGKFDTKFKYLDYHGGDDCPLDFASRYILDHLSIAIDEHENQDTVNLSNLLLKRFPLGFPNTLEFSSFVRETLPKIDEVGDPDKTLLTWVQQDGRLSQRLERQILAPLIKESFWNQKELDFDKFLELSINVINQRESHVSEAFGHHLAHIFTSNKLKFERQTVTGSLDKNTFLFPDEVSQNDGVLGSIRLTILGVKSTCKDRWVQAMYEAARIQKNYLVTIEPGISESQTEEMKAQNLQLIVPRQLHATYRDSQRQWLMDVKEYIHMVRQQQDIHAQV